MKPEERQHFEDLLIKAIQAGKKETSGLVNEILQKLEPAVEKSIEKHVNGKIREVMTNQQILNTKVDNYIQSDNAWKEEADPYIKGLASVTIGGRIVLWIVGAIATLAGAILAVKKLFQ